MTLVDTSVWIDHLNSREPALVELMSTQSALVHPLVFGELACGSIKARAMTLGLLSELPRPGTANHEEALELLESRKLWGTGVGWIDVHLLASSLITHCQFWTRDLRLRKAASLAGVTLFGQAH